MDKESPRITFHNGIHNTSAPQTVATVMGHSISSLGAPNASFPGSTTCHGLPIIASQTRDTAVVTTAALVSDSMDFMDFKCHSPATEKVSISNTLRIIFHDGIPNTLASQAVASKNPLLAWEGSHCHAQYYGGQSALYPVIPILLQWHSASEHIGLPGGSQKKHLLAHEGYRSHVQRSYGCPSGLHSEPQSHIRRLQWPLVSLQWTCHTVTHGRAVTVLTSLPGWGQNKPYTATTE